MAQASTDTLASTDSQAITDASDSPTSAPAPAPRARLSVTVNLDQGWTFRALDTQNLGTQNLSAQTPDTQTGEDPAHDWQAATVPGTVHQDLLAQGRIPDPYLGLNEKQVQWVGDAAWLYRTAFEVTDELLALPHLDLCLDGLDTLCTVTLNGQEVLRSENMFVPHRLDVKALLHAGENLLTLRFDPVLPHGHALQAQHGRRAVWNGDASRVYVRKAQYHYGWDWGPTLLTAGPWKPVYLHAYSARLDEVHAPLTVSEDLARARLELRAHVAGTAQPGDTVRLLLRSPAGEVVAQEKLAVSADQTAALTLNLNDPLLWWPLGYGEQPLYTLRVSLHRGDTVLDSSEQRLGARHLSLRQDAVAGEEGSAFTFVVNGVPIFAGGVNWIPEDLLLNRVSPEQYRERLQQAADAHMVMVRVWGGGIYEHDAFYDACDELGLLVWQDFLFGCGMYPGHPEFLESVRQEAEAAVRRLRHHPCLALWCGNNEDYQIAESVGAYGPDGDTRLFDALAIYEGLLPAVVSALDPQTPYWPGSPYGGAASHDQTVGDKHTWEVWHANMAPHRDYGLYQGRFVSEFGVQSPPSLHSIRSFTRPEDRQPHSRVMEHHNKAADPAGRADGHRRLAVYLSDTFQPARDFEEYVFQARLVQAEAMVSAYRAFRGRWGHEGRRAVSGALVWQLNDCWPVTSWAVIDSSGVPKPAYYAIGRELAPLAVQARRVGSELTAWIASSLTADREVVLRLDVFALDGTLLQAQHRTLKAAANAVTPLPLEDVRLPEEAVAFLRLLDTGLQDMPGTELSRAACWPEPLKHFHLPDPVLSAALEGRTLSVSVTHPAKGVWIDAGAQRLPSNHHDLMPGERLCLTLPEGTKASDLTLRAVGSGTVTPGQAASPAPVNAPRRPAEQSAPEAVMAAPGNAPS